MVKIVQRLVRNKATSLGTWQDTHYSSVKQARRANPDEFRSYFRVKPESAYPEIAIGTSVHWTDPDDGESGVYTVTDIRRDERTGKPEIYILADANVCGVRALPSEIVSMTEDESYEEVVAGLATDRHPEEY